MRSKSVEEIQAELRKSAEAAYRAVTILSQVLELGNLSSDIYQDTRGLIETLYIRAGSAEGEGIAIENYLIPLAGEISKEFRGTYRAASCTSKDSFERGKYAGLSTAMAAIERATGLNLWPEDEEND